MNKIIRSAIIFFILYFIIGIIFILKYPFIIFSSSYAREAFSANTLDVLKEVGSDFIFWPSEFRNLFLSWSFRTPTGYGVLSDEFSYVLIFVLLTIATYVIDQKFVKKSENMIKRSK